MSMVPVLRALMSQVNRIARPGDAARFWLAQIFLIASTIIGVYLAAQVGFEKALEFDALREQRTAYFMLGALRSEVSDNLGKIDSLLEKFAGRIDLRLLERETEMQTFVWRSMQESTETFQVPDRIITGVRRYYAAVTRQTAEMRMQRISNRVFIKRLRAAADTVRREVLPAIDAERARLRAYLIPRGVSLD